MSEEYDVLAAQAQRAEAAGTGGKPYVIRLGERRYEWPAELPVAAVEAAAHMQTITKDSGPEAVAAMTELMRILSGEHADELAVLLSINDLFDIMPKYMEHIGGSGLGESAASRESSPGTPKPRKRTSRRTTASTSSTTTAAR